MAKGRVYIVRNPLFPTLFKIGFTTKQSVEERGLNVSNIPEAFEVIREYECNDYEKVEELFHKTFEHFRYYSQLDKRGKQTEFFSIACLPNVVELLDRFSDVEDITDAAEAEIEKTEEAEEKSNGRLFDKSKIVRRSVFNFSEMSIPKGAILRLAKNPKIKVKVINDKQVEFDGKPESFSFITAKLIKSNAKYVQPTRYWTYDGKNLLDIYNTTYQKK